MILSDNGTISGTPSGQGTFNFTVRVTDSTSAMDTRELSITASAPYANFNISAPSFYTNDSFTIWLNTNLPNTSFTICWTFPNGSQDCSPNWGQTDANGYWSQTGYFPPGLAGSWQEWVVFPGLVTSSPINFTVSDFASFSISSGFHVGDSFTLSLQTSIPNTPFTICAKFPDGGQSCTPNWGQTDANGNWTEVGSFSENELGSWEEWIVFLTATSNTIYFTIIP